MHGNYLHSETESHLIRCQIFRTSNLTSSSDTYSEITIVVVRCFSSPGRIALPVMGPGRKPSDLPDTWNLETEVHPSVTDTRPPCNYPETVQVGKGQAEIN
jgi:hypothetical protein